MLLIRYCWVILKCYLQEHCINVVVVGFYLMDLLSSGVLLYHCVCLPCFWGKCRLLYNIFIRTYFVEITHLGQKHNPGRRYDVWAGGCV